MTWLILGAATFIAAILQTVTGFGFGLLCVPIFLWVTDSIAAIEMVTIITLIMSLAILRSVKGEMVPALLATFCLGCLIGSPIGALLIYQMNLEWLKIMTAVVVLSVTLWNLYHYLGRKLMNTAHQTHSTSGSRPAQVGVGVASGVLGAALAMPAPLVMVYLSGTSYSKNEIRNTILVYFIIAYGLALGFQMATLGVEAQTWKMAFSLLPAALSGVYIGHKFAPLVSPFYFRLIVFITLLITSFTMLANALSN